MTREQEIVDLLVKYSKEYEEGYPSVPDIIYDQLEQELRSLNPDNSFFKKVGTKDRGGKVKLPFPMGSLDQIPVGGIENWIKSNGYENIRFVITDKLDGVSDMNVYRDGMFDISYSRGNGYEGADVTRHMAKLPIPLYSKTNCTVRVETIVPIKDFEYVKIENGREYKNPRNYVAGKMNATESPEAFYQYTKVVATSLVWPKMGKSEQLQFLQEMGYEVPNFRIVHGSMLTDEYLREIIEDRKINSPYEIDGLVIDIDDADLRSSLRKSTDSINPAYSIKYKVITEENFAECKIIDILWAESKDGYLKPRVNIEPVELGGVTIQYLTAFNAKFVVDNNLGPDAVIKITRSGDVIPYILGVITPSPTGPKLPEDIEYSWNESNVDIISDELTDVGKIKKIESFFGGIEVPSLKHGNVVSMYEAGFDSIEKIIKAKEEDFKNSIGNIVGSKIFEGIKKKLTNIELYVLAGASGVLGRGMGQRKMKALISAVGKDFLDPNFDANRVVSVEGFSEAGRKLISENHSKFLQFLSSIEGYYSLSEETEKKEISGPLIGISFCFTGFRDEESKNIIESKGGIVKDGVNKDLTYLVTKDPSSNSGKNKKARELGVKVISIGEMKEIINVL